MKKLMRIKMISIFTITKFQIDVEDFKGNFIIYYLYYHFIGCFGAKQNFWGKANRHTSMAAD